MFGKDDNQQQPTSQHDTTDPAALNAAMPDPITPTPPPGFNIPANNNPAPQTVNPTADPVFSAPELPSGSSSDHTSPSTSTDTDIPPSNSSSADTPHDLVDIKQQALQHLSPLVSHLDQTPEEKFRTTMMMIQASDNKDLIKDAFEAAQNISDDKARAQALLDVINEINYFTQHESPEA